MQRTICMTGPEAAALFYDPHRFARAGAMPMRIQKALLGVGGVQALDGAAHRHRKQLFMSLLTSDRIGGLVEQAAEEWRRAARKWASMEQVVLYDETQELLTRP